jgi:hypothetical protein
MLRCLVVLKRRYIDREEHVVVATTCFMSVSEQLSSVVLLVPVVVPVPVLAEGQRVNCHGQT